MTTTVRFHSVAAGESFTVFGVIGFALAVRLLRPLLDPRSWA